MSVKREYETLWLKIVLFQEEPVRTSGWGDAVPSDSDELEWDDVK